MTILIIEDDEKLARVLTRTLNSMDLQAKHLSSYHDATHYINETANLSESHPIVLLDISLPDGSGVGLARVIAAAPPVPYIITISGAASPAQAFELKQLGVKAFLPKPFTTDQFKQAINQGIKTELELDESAISSILGAMPLKRVTGQVRKTMLIKALEQTLGNITKAAELLKISRQGVQNMITEFDINLDLYKLDKEKKSK